MPSTLPAPSILVVDDDRAACEHLCGLFVASGFRAASAGNCREALDAARRDPPDLALSSLFGGQGTIPADDGLALCRLWHADERLRGIPFVFFADPGDPRLAERIGADRFFARPMEPDVLIAKVREALTLPQEPAARQRTPRARRGSDPGPAPADGEDAIARPSRRRRRP